MFEENEIINFTSGLYDAYCSEGIFKVKKSFDINKELKIYLEKNEDQKEYPAYENFVEYLIKSKFIENFETINVYLGDYKNFELEINYNK